ncbi:glycosyltransferase family 4 protein [Sphingomonas arenae]|uniref:glycosyltransferase family 4 protein n=1 Tax=Sphingomonas arenae TaxID=2812555 RepID=UPI001967D314|nr:glycosyltransferase family 4 protein [Sphingomonas arenae]
MTDPLRILLLTRSYPRAGDLYQYPFVHRRVLAYAAQGHEVTVFRPGPGPQPFAYDHEGVTCHVGGAEELVRLSAKVRPQVVAVHGFSEQMVGMLDGMLGRLPVCAWLHGSEIPDFFRTKALLLPYASERQAALEAVHVRREFWRAFAKRWPDRFRLVLVSRHSAELARKDFDLPEDRFWVIPNPIDTDLFSYTLKPAEQRLRVLMIRPFDHPSYGNDMAVDAIVRLSSRPGFERLQFTIVGDGPLFSETVKPLGHLGNVELRRQFLRQDEIARLHRDHGLFLVPTRLDTQGVSRDEAMSSGLVPITNRVAAVPEFVDDSCAALAGPEDAPGLAERLWEMVEQPALFQARSVAAAERIRLQTGHQRIIEQELELLSEAASRP